MTFGSMVAPVVNLFNSDPVASRNSNLSIYLRFRFVIFVLMMTMSKNYCKNLVFKKSMLAENSLDKPAKLIPLNTIHLKPRILYSIYKANI